MRYIGLLLLIAVLDFSIIDSNVDNSKSIIYIHYSNGLEDKLIVDKENLNNPKVLEVIESIYTNRLKQLNK